VVWEKKTVSYRSSRNIKMKLVMSYKGGDTGLGKTKKKEGKIR